MHDKAADTFPSTIKFVPECWKTKELCHRTVHRWFFVFDSIPDKYKTQEICNLPFFIFSIHFILYLWIYNSRNVWWSY